MFGKKDDKSTLLELYKIAIEMSDRVSSRRMNNNNFFISINGTLLVFLSSMFSLGKNNYVLIVLIFGLIINFIWINHLVSYKNLNKAKFNVIHKIEEKLPFQIFKDEWDEINKIKHKRFSNIEKHIPIIFMSFYVLIIIFTFYERIFGLLKCILANF